MPAVNPTCFHQSASSIAAFKACPTRFRLAYREGLRLATDTDSQRQGTNWHAMHEMYANTLTREQKKIGEDRAGDATVALDTVIDLLNKSYSEVPNTKTPHEWALERQILLTCFIGYLWYWQNDPVEFIASEVAFDLPIHAPKTGLPLLMSEVKRVGKIDHIVKWQGSVGALERKSTSRSIAPDSDYWDKSKKDTQVSMYALAMRDMMVANTFPVDVPSCDRFGNTLYDVWHKPTIKPSMLSQKETAEFMQTGTYCDQQFEIASSGDQEKPESWEITVDGEKAQIEPGKKGFAIRETIGMFGARLLADIYERPEFYFQRREIARSDADLRKFRVEGYAIYQTQKTMDKTGNWYENESQCRATFPCSYIPICYGPGADAVCDGTTTPPNFKRIFVDLTVNGEAIEE